ncbi:MAG: RNA polymerase sporulation sigma factor SigG [Clostridiales bacterium]|nr:RNA polymerase sporulation sigma factor SigG [Clostridia bacterium]MCR4564262.1 RNA polymerase sporulation sigma factor SigG [Clostridiales bacterium]
MQFNKVEICGVNTNNLSVLKESEKISLLRKYRENNDSDAREKLICGNLRLVLSVIQRFSNRGEEMDDLFQVGCIGLMKAIDNFDLNQNVRFSTYAVPMIIGEVRRYLRDNNSLRVSRSLRDTAYKAMQVKEQLQNELNREPSIDEIAKKLGVSVSQAVMALEAIVEPVSLYEPVYSEGGDTIYVLDQVASNESDSDWLDEITIKQGIENLSKRERQILTLRFMQGKTQTEVADEIGISQAQVSRLEKNAIKSIRNG